MKKNYLIFTYAALFATALVSCDQTDPMDCVAAQEDYLTLAIDLNEDPSADNCDAYREALEKVANSECPDAFAAQEVLDELGGCDCYDSEAEVQTALEGYAGGTVSVEQLIELVQGVLAEGADCSDGLVTGWEQIVETGNQTICTELAAEVTLAMIAMGDGTTASCNAARTALTAAIEFGECNTAAYQATLEGLEDCSCYDVNLDVADALLDYQEGVLTCDEFTTEMDQIITDNSACEQFVDQWEILIPESCSSVTCAEALTVINAAWVDYIREPTAELEAQLVTYITDAIELATTSQEWDCQALALSLGTLKTYLYLLPSYDGAMEFSSCSEAVTVVTTIQSYYLIDPAYCDEYKEALATGLEFYANNLAVEDCINNSFYINGGWGTPGWQQKHDELACAR